VRGAGVGPNGEPVRGLSVAANASSCGAGYTRLSFVSITSASDTHPERGEPGVHGANAEPAYAEERRRSSPGDKGMLSSNKTPLESSAGVAFGSCLTLTSSGSPPMLPRTMQRPANNAQRGEG
jgi:hypothetical protein